MALEVLGAPPQAQTVSNPLSLLRLDSAIARSAAGFGVAFMVQSIPVMVTQLPNMNPVWNVVAVSGLVVSLLLAVLASILQRLVRVAHVAFTVVYVSALISWPFAVLSVHDTPKSSFFLYFTLTIATSMATVGLGPRLAIVVVFVLPGIYAYIRTMPEGGDVTVTQAVLDSVYATILGGVIATIIIILRRAAAAVDAAQDAALERYSHVVRQHAIEAERVLVDAIVHDSVLTTLLEAARASTANARALAATMASNAIGHLRDAAAVAPDSDVMVQIDVIASRIADAARTMSRPFAVTIDDARNVEVPIAAAEAIYSAAVQAMVNSLQHAGTGVERWVRVWAPERERVEVEIGDNGEGFDVSTVPNERLGVRVSILERVLSAGGVAVIDSAPGEGTRVKLTWPAPDGSERLDEFEAEVGR